jgi:hypothetical protein
MSRDWDNWRDCEIKRSALEKENDTLKRQIAALESELYKLKLKAHAGGVGVEAIVEKANEERLSFQAQLRKLSDYIPWEIEPQPETTADNSVMLSSGLLENPDGSKYLVQDASQGCLVTYRIFVRHGPEFKTRSMCSPATVHFYPGPIDALTEDLNRLTFLVRREPLPENLPQKIPSGLENVPLEALHQAICRMTPFCYSPGILGEYQTAILDEGGAWQSVTKGATSGRVCG